MATGSATPAAAESAVSAAVEGLTLTESFRRTVESRPDGVALRWKTGDSFAEMTWAEYADRASRLATALSELGVGRGDRVALMMRNRPEFHFADVAVLLLGATPFSIYNTSAAEQITYLLNHSEAKVAIADPDLGERILTVRDELDMLERVVGSDGALGDGPSIAELCEADAVVDLMRAASEASPTDVATLVYTSGTTGPPKGAKLTHASLSWILESFRRRIGVDLAGLRVVSYLPMAHVLERDVSHYLHLIGGSEVTACPEPTEVGAFLRDVRPHFFAAVPRVWEKLGGGLRARELEPEQQAEFDRALELGGRVADARQGGGEPDADLLAALKQADGSLHEGRAALGLDECLVAFSGGAPIPTEVHRFFLALGVPLGEGYGLTESTFVVSFDFPPAHMATVGPPLPEVEMKIADDREVLVRGPFVFDGYLKDPERTAEVIDEDAWLHTGDIGELSDGALKIVDRKKELIITSGGKNISPANIETALKCEPLIGQACVVGDGKPHLVALIVLDSDIAPSWAARRGLEGEIDVLASAPEVVEEITRSVDHVNATLSRAEQVKRFRILHREWLPASDELTPTMKLRRRVVLDKYADELEGLYGEGEASKMKGAKA